MNETDVIRAGDIVFRLPEHQDDGWPYGGYAMKVKSGPDEDGYISVEHDGYISVDDDDRCWMATKFVKEIVWTSGVEDWGPGAREAMGRINLMKVEILAQQIWTVMRGDAYGLVSWDELHSSAYHNNVTLRTLYRLAERLISEGIRSL